MCSSTHRQRDQRRTNFFMFNSSSKICLTVSLSAFTVSAIIRIADELENSHHWYLFSNLSTRSAFFQFNEKFDIDSLFLFFDIDCYRHGNKIRSFQISIEKYYYSNKIVFSNWNGTGTLPTTTLRSNVVFVANTRVERLLRILVEHLLRILVEHLLRTQVCDLIAI